MTRRVAVVGPVVLSVPINRIRLVNWTKVFVVCARKHIVKFTQS